MNHSTPPPVSAATEPPPPNALSRAIELANLHVFVSITATLMGQDGSSLPDAAPKGTGEATRISAPTGAEPADGGDWGWNAGGDPKAIASKTYRQGAVAAGTWVVDLNTRRLAFVLFSTRHQIAIQSCGLTGDGVPYLAVLPPEFVAVVADKRFDEEAVRRVVLALTDDEHVGKEVDPIEGQKRRVLMSLDGKVLTYRRGSPGLSPHFDVVDIGSRQLGIPVSGRWATADVISVIEKFQWFRGSAAERGAA